MRKTTTIGMGSDKTFLVQLYQDDGPFDLTGMTAIEASFPAPNAGSIVESFAAGRVSVVGAPGGGRIQVTVPGVDSLRMQANPVPQQYQDLQVIVTTEGVAQVDSLTVPGAVSAGEVFTVTLNGQAFSYTASTGDTDLVVLTAIQALVAQAVQPFPISSVVSGSAGSAVMTLTSTIPALGFLDQVTANVTITATTVNAGTRAQFVLQGALNIVPQPYPLA